MTADIVASVVSSAVGRGALARVASAVAASSNLPVDRIEDVALVCETLLDECDGAAPCTVQFMAGVRSVRMVFSGLPAGIHDVHPDVPTVESIVKRLADEVWIERTAGGREELHVVVSAMRGAAVPPGTRP